MDYLIQSETLEGIANAIRAKTGSAASLSPANMGNTIENDLVKPSGNKSITAGTSTQTGIDVKDYATVSVAPTPTQSKTLTLGANAPQTVNPDSGYALSQVPVTLDTSVIKAENIKKDAQMLGITGAYEGGTTPTLITKTITQNGAYDAADDNADGYSEVTVAVSGGGGATIVETENEFGGITMTITE